MLAMAAAIIRGGKSESFFCERYMRGYYITIYYLILGVVGCYTTNTTTCKSMQKINAKAI